MEQAPQEMPRHLSIVTPTHHTSACGRMAIRSHDGKSPFCDPNAQDLQRPVVHSSLPADGRLVLEQFMLDGWAEDPDFPKGMHAFDRAIEELIPIANDKPGWCR
jgi:hypothetical protein